MDIKVVMTLLLCHRYPGLALFTPPQAIGALILSRAVAQFHPAAIHFVCEQMQPADSCDQAALFHRWNDYMKSMSMCKCIVGNCWKHKIYSRVLLCHFCRFIVSLNLFSKKKKFRVLKRSLENKHGAWWKQ